MNSSYSKINTSPILEKSINLNIKRKTIKHNLIWLGINFFLLSVSIYHISNVCPLTIGIFHYMEYSLIVIFSLNVLFYLGSLIKLYFSSLELIEINPEQKKLLGIKDSDPNYKVIDSSFNSKSADVSSGNVSGAVNLHSLSPLSQKSWITNLSQNDSSLNQSIHSTSWTYQPYGITSKASTSFTHSNNLPFNDSPPKYSYHNISSVENIDNEHSLNQFLKEHEAIEKINEMSNKQQNPISWLASFWNHPVINNKRDSSIFLKNKYQMSTQLSPSNVSGTTTLKLIDDKVSNSLEVWTRINVDTVALTQWNENLRVWISQTILERLLTEFDIINQSLEKHGMSDIKIGAVGLDRLRKTAQMAQITQFIPSLSIIITFLEFHSNQSYIVTRMRELAQGGCMSKFKWNGGGDYYGKKWDDSLPTDCLIIMHLLSSYLDTQLMPWPNMPDTKSFSGHYYIKSTDKMPMLTKNSLFIQEVTQKPPHYRVIVGEKTYEMVKGYNNLFHSILFLIYHVNKVEQGMLGRINLGRAGINMLWIIGINE